MEQQTETPLQTMPFATTKAKLFEMYLSNYTETEIRIGINTIIADNRKYPADKPVYVKRIRHCELVEFVEIFGLPKGYKNSEK